MIRSPLSWPGRATQLVFVGCLAVYLAGLSPSPYWLDSSELAAASFGLGVAHPPGHPLMLLIGKACALLPLGPIAFRIGLGAALLGALAAALVTFLGARLAERLAEAFGRSDELLAATLGIAAGIAFGLSYAVVFQAIRPEVYTLHAVLILGAACLLERYEASGSRRALLGAALVLGLALANHHLLVLLFLPATAGLLLWRRPSRRLLVVAGAALACGLIAYAYLPLRALRHPLVDWGAPSSPARFFWVVSARAFQKSLGHAAAAPAFQVADAVIRQLRLVAPLALLSAYLLVRLRPTRRLALFLLAAALLDMAAPALIGFDAENPDAYGYLQPAIGLFAALSTGLPMLLVLLRRRRWARLAAAAWLVIVAVTSAAGIERWLRPRFADTERFTASVLNTAPPGAWLITAQFQTAFALWYVQGVEGQRPDVAHLHRHFLSYPGMRDEVLRRTPALARVAGERDVRPTELVAEAARRAVLLEYDLDLDEALARRLIPTGVIDRLLVEPPSSTALEQSTRAAILERSRMALDAAEPQTRRVLLWSAFLDAVRDCRLGRSSASEAVARARSLGGSGDATLEAMVRHCPAAR